MKLGEFELDQIYNLDCYEAIKKIPDKSIDCIYTDIPYNMTFGGGGHLNTNSVNILKMKYKIFPMASTSLYLMNLSA